MVLAAVALGSCAVSYLDRDPRAVELAARLGAKAASISSFADPVSGAYDLTVDASADPGGLRHALKSTRPGGTCVGRSVYFGEVPLPYFDLYGSGVTFVTGPPHATPFVPEVLQLLASGTLDPRPVLAGPHPYDAAPEVLVDPPAGKPVFVHPPTGAA
jgi:alcohol dehydrogenase